MMDRNRKDELPKMQVEFIDVVCRPLYGSLSDSFPWIQPLLNGCLSNREKWIDLAEKVSQFGQFSVYIYTIGPHSPSFPPKEIESIHPSFLPK